MKCTCDGEMPTLLAMSCIVYLPSLSIISLILETVAIPVTIAGPHSGERVRLMSWWL